MYDIIFVGNDDESFANLKERFPTAKRVNVTTTISDAVTSANKKAYTNMFWVVWDDIVIHPDFKFDFKVPKWDEEYVHVFRNSEYFDGVCLFPKKLNVSNREIEYRFFRNKKEIDIEASTPKRYEIFCIDTYSQYLAILEKSTTDMFWVVWSNLNLQTGFNFDYYIPYYDSFHKNITHVFRNGNFYDGVCLFSKKTKVSEREFNYRFFTNKKEIDIEASKPKPFDIVFISYFESFAEQNYKALVDKVQRHVHRVDGVKGIHNAHMRAAELVESDLFWVVDADAILEPTFNFEFPQVVYHDTYTKSIVHVWTSQNPINDLQYGNGGVKLLPRKLTLNMDLSKPDMTTSISASFKAMPDISNIAAFNTDEFTTWRSAFRECVKLSSRTIQGQVDSETEDRLNVWCSKGKDRLYGEYAISGALAGRAYGQENAGNLPALTLINDYDWLKTQFQQTHLPLEKSQQ
jgi:hypothetical protein